MVPGNPNGNNPFAPPPNAYGAPPGAPGGGGGNPFAPPQQQNPFGAPGPNMPAQPRKTPKWVVALAAVPIVSCLACFVWYKIDSAGHTYGDVMAAVCNGGRYAGAAPYVPSALPHRFVWLDHNGTGTEWSVRGGAPVPSGWATLYADQAQLVLCAEAPVTQTIERCPFTNGRFIERRQQQQGIRLIVASTGQVLTQQTLQGGTPRPCNATEAFSGGATSAVLTGEDIGTPSYGPALEPFVTR